jgi:uncharacterized coiled-coil protein SlyX
MWPALSLLLVLGLLTSAHAQEDEKKERLFGKKRDDFKSFLDKKRAADKDSADRVQQLEAEVRELKERLRDALSAAGKQGGDKAERKGPPPRFGKKDEGKAPPSFGNKGDGKGPPSRFAKNDARSHHHHGTAHRHGKGSHRHSHAWHHGAQHRHHGNYAAHHHHGWQHHCHGSSHAHHDGKDEHVSLNELSRQIAELRRDVERLREALPPRRR